MFLRMYAEVDTHTIYRDIFDGTIGWFFSSAKPPQWDPSVKLARLCDCPVASVHPAKQLSQKDRPEPVQDFFPVLYFFLVC